MLDVYELEGRLCGWVVEANGWVQDLKLTGEGSPGVR